MMYSVLIGALGLFLLGMWMMTEGLKLAGGQALKQLLGRWTSTRMKGIASGILVTALVQSSSAVTVATIGFVNTGLMSFSQSLWVIFGSNVGTTFTAWIVTIFGLKVDIGAFTYLMIGVGAILRVFAPKERGKALGMAVAGFGILFLGISELQSAFSGFAESPVFRELLGGGEHQVVLGLIAGIILTVLTQSSSAAIALVLTALASSLINLETAAAAVIGANVGTTSTAMISVIGATANAKRLAIAHLVFNLLTGVVAFLILPLFLQLVLYIARVGNLGTDPTIVLAVFHTLFNIMGVLLMWPITAKLVVMLQRLFRRTAEIQLTPFLDRNVASVPDMAIKALTAQMHALHEDVCRRRVEKDIKSDLHRQWLSDKLAALREVDEYIERVSRARLSENLAHQFADGLAIKHYLENACESLESLGQLYRNSLQPGGWTQQALEAWLTQVSDFTVQLSSGQLEDAQSLWNMQLASYRVMKNTILMGATNRKCTLDELDTALQIASLSKRYAEQLLHTLNRFANLDEENHLVTEQGENEAEAEPIVTEST